MNISKKLDKVLMYANTDDLFMKLFIGSGLMCGVVSLTMSIAKVIG